MPRQSECSTGGGFEWGRALTSRGRVSLSLESSPGSCSVRFLYYDEEQLWKLIALIYNGVKNVWEGRRILMRQSREGLQRTVNIPPSVIITSSLVTVPRYLKPVFIDILRLCYTYFRRFLTGMQFGSFLDALVRSKDSFGRLLRHGKGKHSLKLGSIMSLAL